MGRFLKSLKRPLIGAVNHSSGGGQLPQGPNADAGDISPMASDRLRLAMSLRERREGGGVSKGAKKTRETNQHLEGRLQHGGCFFIFARQALARFHQEKMLEPL